MFIPMQKQASNPVSISMDSAQKNHFSLPMQTGVSLKPEHFLQITNTAPRVGFFEVHAENYLVDGGPFHHYLTRIRQDYTLAIHGVGLSIGGHSPLNRPHLCAIKKLIERYQPAVFSEHLAWSSHDGIFLNDLLPLAYDKNALIRVCAHIDEVQNYLQRTILLENPSSYVDFYHSTFSEIEFIRELIQRTGCYLLLDVNNLYVSCTNHQWNIDHYINHLPLNAIQQIHLAGFTREQDDNGETLLIDSHGAEVDKAVWALYENIINKAGAIPTLIEWDNNIPAFSCLQAEAQQADRLLHNIRMSGHG